MKSILAIVLAPLAAAVAVSHALAISQDSPILERQNTNATDAIQPTTFSFSQLWDLNKKFLDNFIYPADAKQAKAINSTLLAEDVQGRIDITRTFDGRELNTEYIFGLFANLAGAKPDAISLLGVPLSYEILHFAANQNVVSALTRFVFLALSPFPYIPDSYTTQIPIQFHRFQSSPPCRSRRVEHV